MEILTTHVYTDLEYMEFFPNNITLILFVMMKVPLTIMYIQRIMELSINMEHVKHALNKVIVLYQIV